MAKPKQKPIKSALKRRREKRLVTRPAKQRVERELRTIYLIQAQKGARNG
jgi:hypothetical protein